MRRFVVGSTSALTLATLMTGTALAGGPAPGGNNVSQGAPDPVAAVKHVIPNEGMGCTVSTVSSMPATCPITTRLRARVRVILSHNYGANPLCRCQSGVVKTLYAVAKTTNPNKAVVITSAPAGYTGHLTFVVVHESSGWLVNNNYCASNPIGDLYHQLAPKPCS